jgi:O-antigen/teichoic acid export membrane protein
MSKGIEVGAALPSARQLGRRALSLGVANAFDYAIQFLVPVVLVRCLDAADFGEYRLLWLAVGTVMSLATLAMPGSLYYFLPRSDAATKRLYINQTLLFLATSGLISGWAVSAWNPWLPEKMHFLTADEAIVPAFVALWVIAALLDALPTVDERVTWQAKMIIRLSAIRGVALSLAAFLTHDLESVLLALLGFVIFKVAVLLRYVAQHHDLRAPLLRWRAFAGQLSYAAPLGVAGALYGLRAQSDQWVAAALFPLGMFAAFSIAAVLGPLMNLFRLSVNFAFLPSMSRLEAAGDVSGMLKLNSQANVMVAMLLCPLFAFVFVFAEELVTIIYTGTYVGAAPVMRVYILGLAGLVIELATITMLLRQAPFVMAVNLMALIIAAGLNWLFARQIGLAGAAVGSVAAIYLDRVATLWRISRRTRVPMRRLQNLGALAQPMLFSALAAAFAWALVDRHFAASGPQVGVTVGGVLLLAAYGMLQGLFRLGRGRARL